MSMNYKKERSFGFVFATFFIIISAYIYLFNDKINYILVLASLLFFFFSILYPKIFFYPSKLWLKFGHIIGLITTPIIISIMYLFIVIPTALVLKILRKDILDRKYPLLEDSNWKSRNVTSTNLDKQF